MSICVKWTCEQEAASGRPWCAGDDPLTPEEQAAFQERSARRAAAAAKWGLTGRVNTCSCGAKAEPDRDTCELHPNRCIGQTVMSGRCTKRELVDGYCRAHHPLRRQMDKPMDMSDPVGCFECGRPTVNVDATCWPCRTSVLV